jgi:Protein of unknown function (DUF3592)
MPDRRRLWPQTTGRVTKTELLESGRVLDETYEAVIHFSYTVGDTTYTGRDSTACEFKSQARQIIGRHPRGATVPVYYDPAQPAQGVLEQTLDTAEVISGISLLVGGIFGYIGLVLLSIIVLCVILVIISVLVR